MYIYNLPCGVVAENVAPWAPDSLMRGHPASKPGSTIRKAGQNESERGAR